jgi:hypothetical protein
MDGLDDLGVADALQVDRRDAAVAVAELALDDDRRHAFARQFDGVGVSELVWREAASDAGLGGGVAQVGSRAGCRPPAAACRTLSTQSSVPTRSCMRTSSHGCSSSHPRRPCRPHDSCSLARRTTRAPRRWSRSASVRASASWMRSPGRHRITMSARRWRPCAWSPAACTTAMISLIVGDQRDRAGPCCGAVDRRGSLACRQNQGGWTGTLGRRTPTATSRTLVAQREHLANRAGDERRSSHYTGQGRRLRTNVFP